MKHGTSNMAELELEALKPTLSEPSGLLQVEQIEKVALLGGGGIHRQRRRSS